MTPQDLRGRGAASMDRTGAFVVRCIPWILLRIIEIWVFWKPDHQPWIPCQLSSIPSRLRCTGCSICFYHSQHFFSKVCAISVFLWDLMVQCSLWCPSYYHPFTGIHMIKKSRNLIHLELVLVVWSQTCDVYTVYVYTWQAIFSHSTECNHSQHYSAGMLLRLAHKYSALCCTILVCAWSQVWLCVQIKCK